MTGETAGQPARDPQAEQDHAEFTGWAEAQGIDPLGMDYAEYGADGMREAFAAGMQAQRDLDAAREPHAAPVMHQLSGLIAGWRQAAGECEDAPPDDHASRAEAETLREVTRQVLAVMEAATEPKPAPELAAALAETRALLDKAARTLQGKHWALTAGEKRVIAGFREQAGLPS